MTEKQANWIVTAFFLLIIFAIIIGVTSRGKSKKNEAIPVPSHTLYPGQAILKAGSPVCENAAWVWRYASYMADQKVKKADKALEHCTVFDADTPVTIESLSDQQRIVEIRSNESTGFTHSGAIVQ